ncbi:MAG: hypothetical protein N3Z28_00995 [Synechococcaceae cyanobacterium MAG-AL2]|uniref:hypothetical protein n=1 Tax=Candidatus Regnicoccus frigidus TaxID=3074015 RepID=UPI00282C2922|nr:hypothetical protein [Candidatus Regnicoccus frigidus]MCT4366228.1 hypothetical protein [Candidatus Regnicoccus frigidus MAG-AL2]
MKGQIIRESMALPVVSAAPGSLLLFDSLQCSFHSLNAYQPSLTSALLDITRPAIRRRLRALQEPMIGINVRCGKDFRSPPEEGAGSEWVGWLQQTPISWFRETLLTVRGRAGYAVPPSASKVDASPSRPLSPPGGLMEQFNAWIQRGRQG